MPLPWLLLAGAYAHPKTRQFLSINRAMASGRKTRPTTTYAQDLARFGALQAAMPTTQGTGKLGIQDEPQEMRLRKQAAASLASPVTAEYNQYGTDIKPPVPGLPAQAQQQVKRKGFVPYGGL